jgi:MraZ protein
MILQEGTSAGTLDSKGRFQLPMAMLRDFPAENEGRFVINRSSDKCLTLYPIDVWNEYKAAMSHMNIFDPDDRRVVRYFLGSATEVRLDSKNRLLIPQPLQEYAQLEKELQIITMKHFIEIWNPKLYNEDIDESSEKRSEGIKKLSNIINGYGRFADNSVS